MQWDNKNMKNNSGRAGTFVFVLPIKKVSLETDTPIPENLRDIVYYDIMRLTKDSPM